jgi:predicted SAM-dependent methyltransferase
MNLTTDKQSSLIADEFEKAVSTIRPQPGFTAFRCSLSNSISLTVTNLLQQSGFNRRILEKLDQSPIILNIGCADHLGSEYVNADIFPPVGPALRMLTGRGKIGWNLFVNIICRDESLVNSADGVVFAHVLEHIPPDKAMTALTNCLKYLKPGAPIRLSVPHIRAYPYSDLTSADERAKDAIARNQLIYGHFHQYMYEPELLIALLEQVGFCDIKQVNFEEGALGTSDRLERRDESIYITASRPL